MPVFSAQLNALLVEIYRNIQILEESELKRSRLNLSISELHLIELIAKSEAGVTISEIAQRLKISKPSVTVAVNKLTQKGYCEKGRRAADGRSVLVTLTPSGSRVEAFHSRCHRNMILSISNDFSEEEKRNLLLAMEKINVYFKTKL